MAFKGEITESDLEDLAKPRLRLFMSVDVVGSTAFKHHSEKADAQGWLDFFTAFYFEFPELLVASRERLLEKEGLPRDHLPQAPLWKALGDELVFVAELTHPKQAELHLVAFSSAISKAVTKWHHGKGGKEPLPVNFKATAWLAGFPVGNAAVPIDDGESEVPYDFVGPSLDVGFRLAQFASPRRFVVSVELALLILEAGGGHSEFHCEKKEVLKGVLNNRGYPIIWIDNYGTVEEEDLYPEHRLTEAEDDILDPKKVENSKLKTYCLSFIDEIGPPLMRPFIKSEDIPTPEGYEEKREDVEARLRDVFTVRLEEDEEPESPDSEESIDDLEKWEPDDE